MLLPRQTMPFILLLLFLRLGGIRPAASADEQFVFDGFIGADLTLNGMAMVTPNGLLQLTVSRDEESLVKGHAFYPWPLQFHRPAPNSTAMQSFSTAFVIGIIGAYEDLSSHGMAFIIAKSNNFTSALPGQFLGLVGSANEGNATNHLFAVEFDTILNSEFNDMSDNHVGIDVNGLNSVDADNAGYYDDGTGAFKNLSLVSRKPMQVWVDFDGQTMQVNVTMAPLEVVARPEKPLLSTTVNLSSVIDDIAYVGFSSASGLLFCRHYVLGWSFNMNGVAPALNISSLPSLPVTRLKPRSKTLEIMLPIASVVLVLAVYLVASVFKRRRRMHAEHKEEWEVEFGPHRFSYQDPFRATDGFNDRQLLGIGGFGRVYRGVIPASKVEVAVKKLSDRSKQGMKEFVAEIVSIGRVQHRNLVRLLGYCRHKGQLLLVYDYMHNGSLDKHLYDHNKATLSWEKRFRIIKGVTSGLLYLHENWEQVVLHRDVKASNVVLDEEMNARLADFGLARLHDHGTELHTMHVAGTIGYLAPELRRTGKASKASDVYAFGVFMMEVACGRKPVARDDHLMLADWVLDRWRAGSVTDAVDPRLHDNFVAHEAILVLKLGLLCSQPLPSARPGMRQIERYLDGDVLLPELPPTCQTLDILSLTQERNPEAYTGAGMSQMSDLSGGR